MYIKLHLPTLENKTRPRKFQNAHKYVVQHRKVVNMPHQNQILHFSWLTSRNATPSIGSLYKLPTLFAPLFCDVIADKVYTQVVLDTSELTKGVDFFGSLCIAKLNASINQHLS